MNKILALQAIAEPVVTLNALSSLASTSCCNQPV